MSSLLAVLLLSASIESPPQTPVRPAPDPAVVEADRRAATRDQFQKLARLVTMSDPWHLEDLDLRSCTEALEKIVEYQSMSFDADPALASVGPGVVDFLVRARSTVIPGLRASLDPEKALENPEGALVALLVEHASRYMENSVLREWQCQFDRLCQSSWKRLVPLARTLGGPLEKSPPIRLRVQGTGSAARLLAENATDRSLTNVVLALSLTSIEGESLDHVYVVDAWASKEVVPLRVAVDWWPVGAARTVGGTIEVIADEMRTESRPFQLPENVAAAVRATLASADLQLAANNPAAAMKLVAGAMKAADRVSSKMPELLQECRAKNSAIVGDLTARRVALEKEQEAVRAELRAAQDEFSRAYRSAEQPRAQKAVDRVKKKLEDVTKRLDAVRKVLNSRKSDG